MRLLQRTSNGSLELTRDQDQAGLPEYAILSHTWQANDEEEVHFEDLKLQDIETIKPAAFYKLQFCASQAAEDGLQYFWVDTCCINRKSSAELQEAICSMFTWYRNATRCYVYLADVSTSNTFVSDDSSWESAFRHSRWFTRGWTLQELLAPASVEFFSREGIRLGDKRSLGQWIHEITGIPHAALRGEDLDNFSVEERLSWTKYRQTRRKEDMAYCLLGIFKIFMPLMYGEGDHAFARLLREEARKKHDDNARMDACLSTLPVASEAAFNSLNNQHQPTCLENTRVELLREITEWVDHLGQDRGCIFWLSGMAGTGKSTIARTIARTYHDKGHLGASFFFSRGGGDLSNADILITTLARQLAISIPATSMKPS